MLPTFEGEKWAGVTYRSEKARRREAAKSGDTNRLGRFRVSRGLRAKGYECRAKEDYSVLIGPP